MPNNISNFLLKPNSKEEKDYCKKYNIELLRLKNGITILGFPCQKDSSAYAEINWTFSEGAFRNTPGAVHFLEHFFNKNLMPITQLNSIHCNAHTNQLEISEEISGIANPEVPDYGIWNSLNEIRNALESPTSTVKDLAKSIKSEKEVIKAEIKQKESEQSFQAGKHYRNFIFGKSNPLRDIPQVPGTKEDVDKLTVKDIKQVEEKVLIPKNLIIDFYTEGSLEIGKEITKRMKNLFSNFPRQNSPKNSLDKKLLDITNPDAKPGTVDYYDPGLNNGLVTYSFSWIFKNKYLSKDFFAFKNLRGLLWDKLHVYSREKGWGYKTDIGFTIEENMQIMTLVVEIRKGNKFDFQKGIKEVVKKTLDQAEIYIRNEAKRQEATPLSVIDRLSWAKSGLQDYGSIIDADKVRNEMGSLTTKNYKNILNYMLKTSPITLITGDLS